MNVPIKNVFLDDIQLSYEVYGSGDTVILCFHGNSKSAEDFQFLAKESRTVISVHLFLHGYSTFSPERITENLIKKHHVIQLIEEILDQEKVDQFHWVAYSQGGLFTLTAFPSFAERIKSIFLIAPDGMNEKGFYTWSQHKWWARKLFKRWVEKPQELMTISRVLAKGKIIHPKLVEFLAYYTSDQDRLDMAYETWSAFRDLQPSDEEVKKAIEQHDINFNLIVGEHDKIITTKTAQQFLEKINKEKALKVIPYGHDVFKPHIEKELLALMPFEELE